MRKYKKPVMQVERFAANTAIAASCTRTYTGTTTTTTYPAQTVTCAIGGQSETIFSSGTSGCYTKATNTAIGWYDGVEYFCWCAETGASDTVPSDTQKALMASVTGVAEPRNWHYCKITSITTSTENRTDSY